MVADQNDMAQRCLDWFHFARDAAMVLQTMAHFERRFSGTTSAALPSHWSDIKREAASPTVVLYAQGLTGVIQDLAKMVTFHHITRLAARVMLAWRDGENLPVDEAAFETRWPGRLAAKKHGLALRYERLDPRRFRLTVDPVAPVPVWADPADSRPESEFGAAPAEEQWVVGPFCVEIVLQRRD